MPSVLLNFALALSSAILLVLTFPRFDIFWFAPVALTPLLVAAARERTAWRRFLMGEAAGTVFWFAICYWFQFVLSSYGGMSPAAAWGTLVLFSVAKALQIAVFTLLSGYLMDRAWAIPAVAALWVGLERTNGPLGFAWLCLGNAGIDMSIPLRVAPWLGVYGVSFLFAMMGCGLALVFLRRPREHLVWLASLVVLLILPSLPAPASGDRSAVSIQTNVAMDERWTPQHARELRDDLGYLTLEGALSRRGERPDLVVWPEVPAPFYYQDDPTFRDEINRLAQLTQTYMLIGVVAHTPTGAPLNSAQLVSPAGAPIARYDKMFLVPFGEFIPPGFGWINRITQESGDFSPGTEVITPLVGDRRIGIFICYESAFPHLVRQFANQGGEVFFNLSNDGYFGHTAAREQHLLIARMRAVENRRWLIRSTNNGITASIDPAGRLVAIAPEFTRTIARLPFRYISEKTFYTRYGDWFAWLCLVLGFAAAVWGWLPIYRP